MKRIMSIVVAGAMALGSVVAFGVGTASAAQTTPTVVLSGAAGEFPGTTPPLVATTSVAGSVTFTVGGATITGCSSVPTSTATPFIATCSWAATAAGPVVFGASFVPTDTTDNANATAAPYNVTIAPPIQGDTAGPISFIVDAVGTANSCGIQSQFVVGDGIVFRVAANDAALGGAALTSANVSSAVLTVNGYATTIHPRLRQPRWSWYVDWRPANGYRGGRLQPHGCHSLHDHHEHHRCSRGDEEGA